MFHRGLLNLQKAAARAPRQYRNKLTWPLKPRTLTLASFRPAQVRYNSSFSGANGETAEAAAPGKTAELKMDSPQLMIAFTCKVCDTRSSHTFSKQSYTKGSVLIQCPGCKNRHLIADNLNVFRDEKVNLEDLLRAKGESVAQSTEDLAFEDIPESLKATLGRYAKDAPEEYQVKDPENQSLGPGEK
ncbi:hypothetical protein OXX59_001799 [Metschnikowia pulcherrima]